MKQLYSVAQTWIFFAIACFLMEGVVLLFQQIKFNDKILTMGSVFSYALILTLPLWIVFFKLVKQTSKPFFTAFLLSLVMAIHFEAYLQYRENQLIYKTAQTWMVISNNQFLPAEKIKSMNFGRYENFMLITDQRFKTINHLFSQSLNNNKTLFQKASLTMEALTDAKISDQKLACLSEIETNINETESAISTQFNSLFNLINDTKIPFKAIFLKKVQEKSSKITISFDREKKLIENYRQLYRFMQSSERHYTVTDGRMVFENKADVDKFNFLLNEVKAEQEGIQNAILSEP